MDRVSEYLKAQREARNVTLEELSKGTLISVAVLKDIEAGKFEKYKGDELYVKMYLKRIAEFLEIDSRELVDGYISVTQEIQLEDLQKKKDQKKAYNDKKGNVTFVGKLGETIKEIKPSSSLQKAKSKRVYEDNYVARFLKYGLVILLCAVIVFVIWYSIIASKSSDNTPYTSPSSGDVEKNPDASTDQETSDGETPKEEKEPAVISNVVINGIGGSNYEVAGIKAGETLKIEVTFKAPGQFNLFKGKNSVEGAYKTYAVEEKYVYETPFVAGERYYFNFWNLSNAEIKINGTLFNYDPATVSVLQGGVSSISLLVKGE